MTAEQYNALACNLNNGGFVTQGDGGITTNIVSVGTFLPNAYGLYDMLGNVRELVREDGDTMVSAEAWAAGGENVIGKISAMSDYDTATVGGSFSESGFGFSTQHGFKHFECGIPLPEFLFDVQTPPMCFVHGDADGYSAMNSVKLWDRLRRMGVQSDLHTLATRGHCFQFKAADGTGSATWFDRVWDFLSRKVFNK